MKNSFKQTSLVILSILFFPSQWTRPQDVSFRPTFPHISLEGDWALRVKSSATLSRLSYFAIVGKVTSRTIRKDIKSPKEGVEITEFEVSEVLNGVDRFPLLKRLKWLSVAGPGGFEVGQRAVVFVDDEGIEQEYVLRDFGLRNHYGLVLPSHKELKALDLPTNTADVFINLFRKETMLDPTKLSPRELRAWAWADPDDVAERMIEALEKGDLKRTK